MTVELLSTFLRGYFHSLKMDCAGTRLTYDVVVEVFINFLWIWRRLPLVQLPIIHLLNTPQWSHQMGFRRCDVNCALPCAPGNSFQSGVKEMNRCMVVSGFTVQFNSVMGGSGLSEASPGSGSSSKICQKKEPAPTKKKFEELQKMKQHQRIKKSPIFLTIIALRNAAWCIEGVFKSSIIQVSKTNYETVLYSVFYNTGTLFVTHFFVKKKNVIRHFL